MLFELVYYCEVIRFWSTFFFRLRPGWLDADREAIEARPAGALNWYLASGQGG